MFNQLFIGIILVLSLGGYWLYSENQTLKINNSKLEGAVAEQKAAIVAIQESFAKQGKSLQNLQRNYNQIEQEKDQYLAIFAKHNLDKLALAKPGLIELRINNGTATVFGDIENDSKAISELDAPDVP
jgi:cell shape-determining protein MreC|tara:strand:- start:778 stop:1161 length:384 start_codon:yes stop_codon:yes gene_type:complete